LGKKRGKEPNLWVSQEFSAIVWAEGDPAKRMLTSFKDIKLDRVALTSASKKCGPPLEKSEIITSSGNYETFKNKSPPKKQFLGKTKILSKSSETSGLVTPHNPLKNSGKSSPRGSQLRTHKHENFIEIVQVDSTNSKIISPIHSATNAAKIKDLYSSVNFSANKDPSLKPTPFNNLVVGSKKLHKNTYFDNINAG
jgi:hypothetical protein